MQSTATQRAIEPADFDAETPLDAIVDFVDEIKVRPGDRRENLVPLLSEGHPLYANRSANEVLKLRAYTMAALELTGLPDAAMPYVRESLESSLNPYTVAAAARALRGTDRSEPGMLELLFKAIFRVWQSDRPVNFTGYRVEWPQREVSSGLTEIFQTLEHFGTAALNLLPALEQLASDPEKFSDRTYSCLRRCINTIRQQPCDGTVEEELTTNVPVNVDFQRSSGGALWPPAQLELEDQDGRHLIWNDFFGHKPTLIGFFYTRCGNPYKCTRTILNLARVQNEVESRGVAGQVRVCAVSYDAQFDTSAALRSYGDARNFRFNEDYRMFRVLDGFDQLVDQMELEVSFVDSQVSSHRIELFVLDQHGAIAHSFVRFQSEPDEVADALVALVDEGYTK